MSKAATQTTNTSRDTLRSAILSSTHRKTKIVEFFGQDIELRQMSWGEAMSSFDSDGLEGNDAQTAAVKGLVRCAYIPGTDEKVFEDTDRDALMALPFGADIQRVFEALTELSEANPTSKSNGLDKIHSSSQPTA